MKISQATRTTEGYLKYSKLDKLEINTIPKLILSKVFSYSDKKAEKFLSILESLYENPLIKPVLDVVAVHIAKNDDVFIIYGATLPSSTNGRYSGDAKRIEIQAHLDDEDLTTTITHEFSHLLADILFANNHYGFRDGDIKQQTIYTETLHSFALKFAQVLYPRIDAGVYSALDGKQLLNFSFNRIASFKDDTPPPRNAAWDEFNKLKIFFNSFLISTDIYKNDGARDAEVFARIIESFLSIKDNPNVAKLLGEFSDYYYRVLNPAINEYMHSNQRFVDKLNIKTNEFGSYGIKVLDLAKVWDKNEELYFAVVNGNDLKAKELILDGADPNHMFFSFVKIINVAIKRDNLDVFKFMVEHSKNIDFESKDVWNKTTLELAKDAGDEFYDVVKDIELKEEDGLYLIEVEYYPEVLMQMEELHPTSDQLVTMQDMA